MLLTKTQDGVSERAGGSSSTSPPPCRSNDSDDGSAGVSEAFGPRSRGRGVRQPAAVQRRSAKPRRPSEDAAQDRSQAHRCARTARSAARSTRSSQNGVWIRQEPVFDSPLNLGAHCAKGASVREHGDASSTRIG